MTGESSYSQSLDYLIKQVQDYPVSEEAMNYRLTFADQSQVLVDLENSPELNKFLETINNGEINWCQ